MKKVVIMLIISVGLLLWQSVSLYITVQADKERDISSFIPTLEAETGYQIVDVDRFHGEELYIVFTAFDPEENEYSYIFLNESHHYEQFSFNNIQISKETAITLAREEFPELISIARVVPGIVNQQYVWELSGYDGEDNLHYIYYTMGSGSFLKRYTVNLLTK